MFPIYNSKLSLKSSRSRIDVFFVDVNWLWRDVYCVQVMHKGALLKSCREKLLGGLLDPFLESESEPHKTERIYYKLGIDASQCSASLTSAKPWHWVPSIPSGRRRGLCTDSSRPLGLVGHEKTDTLVPDKEQRVRLKRFVKVRAFMTTRSASRHPTLSLGRDVFSENNDEMSSLQDTRVAASICRQKQSKWDDSRHPFHCRHTGNNTALKEVLRVYSIPTQPDVCASHVFFLKGQHARANRKSTVNEKHGNIQRNSAPILLSERNNWVTVGSV